jgi:hypothetical protein
MAAQPASSTVGATSGSTATSSVDELTFDPSLTWAVVLVEEGDTLNVRSDPGVGNDVVGELAPDATGAEASVETVMVGSGSWRAVRHGSVEGWVNDRFLAAAPSDLGPDDLAAMEQVAAALDTWLASSESTGSAGQWLSPDGLHIGGIGVYGDIPFAPRLVPSAQLATRQGWETPVDFTPDGWDGSCDCTRSPLEFIGVPPPERSRDHLVDQVLLDDDGTRAGDFESSTFINGMVQSLDGMHHVTVSVPATSDQDLDWQRIHLFFDWRTGQPLVHTIYTWGWTP